ncbi:MAG: beta-ketoacyl-ACP synthase III [Pseudomonadota bacterium]
MTLRSYVAGCGAHLPEKVLTNDDITKIVDTTDDWIQGRTGISERRIVEDNEFTSDLAAAAAKKALENAGKSASDVDLIIVATATPDLTFPATAAIVQAKLGISNCTAFDLQAVCSGFIYAVSTADKFLRSGSHKCALVIGAETFSRILDWEDRTTCVLFGDGAGAFVMTAQFVDDDMSEQQGFSGIIETEIQCDGQYVDLLYVDGGVSRTQTTGHLRMQGNKVFRQAIERISSAMVTVCDRSGIYPKDIDWFVPHQANERIIHGIVTKLELRSEQVVSTIAKHGNTSAASIPLAYSTAVEDGRIKSGDLVMLEAMGGGLTWGAILLRA